jgi:hypothetical protein
MVLIAQTISKTNHKRMNHGISRNHAQTPDAELIARAAIRSAAWSVSDNLCSNHRDHQGSFASPGVGWDFVLSFMPTY